MALRPVFSVNQKNIVITEDVEFKFYSGFADSQKKKCINSLHESYLKVHPDGKILEISTKSDNLTGVSLSAFNLKITRKNGEKIYLESAFQSAKVFENGGPYVDIASKFPWEAKKDQRLRASGAITHFSFDDLDFPAEPKTFFYDWIYVKAVKANSELASQIVNYDAFTDIEFNPQKSINCQARSAAIFVALVKRGLLDQAIQSPEKFREIVYGRLFAECEKDDQNEEPLQGIQMSFL